MRCAHSSPTACNGQEDVWLILDELSLNFRREHQVAEALFLRCKRREYAASYTEVRRAHMRTLNRSFQAQRNAAEICGFHSFAPQLLS